MTLLNAPQFDAAAQKRKVSALIALGILFGLAVVVTLAGFLLGHGWGFSNIPIEHKVDRFFTDIEHKDFAAAYGVYVNDPQWQQHPDKYKDYPLPRFTEDWTTQSPVKTAIVNHHIDISKSDGTGTFGTGVIVAVRVNGDHKVFMWYQRSDGQLTWPAPHILEY